MKVNRLISLLSFSIILGSIIGLANSVYYIAANRYLNHHMIRLTLLSFEGYLSQWIIWFIIIVFTPVVILWLCYLTGRLATRLFLSNIIEIHIKDSIKLRNILLAIIVCLTILFYGGYRTWRYWLPRKLDIAHILMGVGILAFVTCFGWILTKVKWDKFCELKKTYRKVAGILIIFLLLLKVGNIVVGQVGVPEGPNVILLVVDALRSDALSCYNEDIDDTPGIDMFAENSVLFKNFIAQSSCTINSAPSIFCSVYPYEHGYFNYNCVVPYRLNTIAELLRNEGYYTFGISTNPHVTSRNGLSQGFDFFEEDLVWEDANCDEVNKRFTGWLEKWLDKDKRKPFFATIWYIDPHAPYDPPRQYIDKYITTAAGKELICPKTIHPKNYSQFTPAEKEVSKKLYAGEVNFFDSEFAKLINQLEQYGLTENSIIILTSDHGESFWEKTDSLGAEVKGHGTSLYREQIDVPFIISLPAKQQRRVVLDKAQHIDIVPTILDYTGVRGGLYNDLGIRGNSLRSLIEGGSKLKRNRFFSQLITDEYGPYYMDSIQTENFKLISTLQCKDVSYKQPHLSMFDLVHGESEVDITEKVSEAIFTDLHKQLEFWEGNLSKVELATQRIKFRGKDEQSKLKKRLKSLGYLQ